jgi:hypothetical protein
LVKKGTRVFGTNGQYVETIVRDRLTYLHQDSAPMGSTFSAGNIGGSGKGNVGGAGINANEPEIPKKIKNRCIATVSAIAGLALAFLPSWKILRYFELFLSSRFQYLFWPVPAAATD